MKKAQKRNEGTQHKGEPIKFLKKRNEMKKWNWGKQNHILVLPLTFQIILLCLLFWLDPFFNWNIKWNWIETKSNLILDGFRNIFHASQKHFSSHTRQKPIKIKKNLTQITTRSHSNHIHPLILLHNLNKKLIYFTEGKLSI